MNLLISDICWSVFLSYMEFILTIRNMVFVYKHQMNQNDQLVLLIKKNYSKIFVVDIERLIIFALLIHLMTVCGKNLFFSNHMFSFIWIENDISKASWLTPKIRSAFHEAYDKLLQSVSDQNTTLKNAPSYVFFEKKIFNLIITYLFIFILKYTCKNYYC